MIFLLHGEQKIIASGCKYVIIRTAWLYSEFGKNFCKTMLNLTATKRQLKVVFDQCGTPTYALDLANAILNVLDKAKATESKEEYVGIYHFSNEGVCSWYDFTQMIAKISGHTDCDIQPCYSSEYPSPVTRPAYSVLDKRTIKEIFGVKVCKKIRQCLRFFDVQHNAALAFGALDTNSEIGNHPF